MIYSSKSILKYERSIIFLMPNQIIGAGRILPPPLGTLLWFAANGLSISSDGPIRSRKPSTPELPLWVPTFREYVESPSGLQKLKLLTEAGMRAKNAPPDYFLCLEAAFRYPGFRALAITALENYADTAREPFTLREPPPHPPAADTRPRPENSGPKSPRPTMPRRGPRRPRFEPK